MRPLMSLQSLKASLQYAYQWKIRNKYRGACSREAPCVYLQHIPLEYSLWVLPLNSHTYPTGLWHSQTNECFEAHRFQTMISFNFLLPCCLVASLSHLTDLITSMSLRLSA